MSQTRILYYDLETKDIIKIVREIDNNFNHPFYEVPFDDVREFIDGTKVQSQYYVKLNPKDPDDFSLLKKLTLVLRFLKSPCKSIEVRVVKSKLHDFCVIL